MDIREQSSPAKRKKMKGMLQEAHIDGGVSVDVNKQLSKLEEDAEGFTLVPSKRSARLGGKAVKNFRRLK